jgi:hypothetical protein
MINGPKKKYYNSTGGRVHSILGIRSPKSWIQANSPFLFCRAWTPNQRDGQLTRMETLFEKDNLIESLELDAQHVSREKLRYVSESSSPEQVYKANAEASCSATKVPQLA